MKKVVSIIIVLALIAGTILAVKNSRSKTFAQENLEALTAGELTPEQIERTCFLYCKINFSEECVLENNPYAGITLTCEEYEDWP